jgi:DNA polymerase III alpha subunit
MQIDGLGRITFNSKDLIKEIYRGNKDKISNTNIFSDDIDYVKYLEFIEENNLLDWPIPTPQTIADKEITEFDHINQQNWFMPDEYKNLDIDLYLVNLAQSDEEIMRVTAELILFKEHNMMNLLRFLKYLVDTMRKHNILWGVGRGSSVASYCLYLLGVHKIDSIKYDLDIKEFLK